MVGLILEKTWQHLQLVIIALTMAMALGLPWGLFLAISKRRRLVSGLLRAIASFQAVPGLALLALTVALLSLTPLPATGFLPATIVLVVYALFPVVTSTHDGIQNIDATIVEVAVGMGMHNKQVLFEVQVPLALPQIVRGVRTAAIWIIALVTLTSLAGSGGLGDLIVQGLRTMNVPLILAGTIPAVAMTLLFDALFARLAVWIVPHTVS